MKNKALVIDRDGVINLYREGHVKSPEEFEFLPRVIEAFKLLRDSNYKTIIITNQSGIAKGYLTEEDLKKIHEKMCSELKMHGIVIDQIYYCPHLRADKCECRKPNIGLFKLAEREHNLDWENSFVIGDTAYEIAAGKKLNSQTILTKTGYDGEDKFALQPDFIVEDLYEAINLILNG